MAKEIFLQEVICTNKSNSTESTAALVEWYHMSSATVYHPHGYTWLDLINKIFPCIAQTSTPSSHVEQKLSLPDSFTEQLAATTTWTSYVNSSLCFSQSEPFSSFHAPNTPKQSVFPQLSACPSLFGSDTSLIHSKDSLQKGAHCHTAQGGKSSKTMKDQAALFWGSGVWTVSSM